MEYPIVVDLFSILLDESSIISALEGVFKEINVEPSKDSVQLLDPTNNTDLGFTDLNKKVVEYLYEIGWNDSLFSFRCIWNKHFTEQISIDKLEKLLSSLSNKAHALCYSNAWFGDLIYTLGIVKMFKSCNLSSQHRINKDSFALFDIVENNLNSEDSSIEYITSNNLNAIGASVRGWNVVDFSTYVNE